jgi:predicted metal-dependent peptidase
MNDSFLQSVSEVLSQMMVTTKQFLLPLALELLDYSVIKTELPGDSPAAISVSKKIIIFNDKSEFFKNNNCISLKQLICLLISHESLHSLCMHEERLHFRNRAIWGCACDYVVNYLLLKIYEEIVSVKTNINCILPNFKNLKKNSGLLDEKFFGKIEEEIYDILIKENPFSNTKETLEMIEIELNGESIKLEGICSELKIDGNKIKILKIVDDKNNKETEENSEQVLAEAENKIYRRNLLQSSLSKGLVSSDFKKFVDKLFKVKIKWETILKDSLRTIFEKKDESSWSRVKILSLAIPEIGYLPGILEEESYGTIIFMNDVSGSMSDDDFRKSISAIRQSCTYFKNLYVIQHDVEVLSKEFYHSFDELESNLDQVMIRHGNGGTSHKDVFNEVCNFLKSSNENNVSIIIGLSDLCSDIPTYQNLLPSNIPVIWLTSQDSYSDNIKGKIIKIEN